MEVLGLTLLAVITILMTLAFDFVNGFNDSATVAGLLYLGLNVLGI